MKMSESAVKVVVITGCSSGIGLDTAVCLSKEKDFKVIATMRNLQKKSDLEKAAEESLNKSLFIQELDISKEDSIMAFVKATHEKEGHIDVLVNNAAMGQRGAFEAVSMEQMQALFQTNVFGTCKLTQEVVRKMKQRESGRIIFISSILGLRPSPYTDFYVATKFAIEGIVGSLAPVLRQFNIYVTSIEPGLVKTAISSNLAKNKQATVGSEAGVAEAGVDAKTNALRDSFRAGVTKYFAKSVQQGVQVAEVIKRCIYEENPSVRIQTSEAMAELARDILVDITGDKINEVLSKYME